MGINYKIKAGSTFPKIECAVKTVKAGGLTGAQVTFRMIDSNNALILDRTATVNAAANVVSYKFALGETDLWGQYWGEFWIIYADGDRDIQPEGYISITFEPSTINI